ncbi:hypothetical protein GYA54_03475 [Candidatus Kuenenbacteria bacterium]|nr:hypothetical protein [Candidatus Kuenenbacteria bacterium]
MAKGVPPLFKKLEQGIAFTVPSDIHIEQARAVPKEGDNTLVRPHIARLVKVGSGYRFATAKDGHYSPALQRQIVSGIVVFLDNSLLGREVEVDWVYTHPTTERQSIALIAAD